MRFTIYRSIYIYKICTKYNSFSLSYLYGSYTFVEAMNYAIVVKALASRTIYFLYLLWQL